LDYAFDNGISLIMWIGGDEIVQGVVKIKSLNEKKEYVIDRNNMIEKIRELIEANPILVA
jgi:histidyl-tRNA synthetase